jgi:GNAT superfamily N-acetyltransferase
MSGSGITYTFHDDAAALRDFVDIGHLAGKYLTPERLEHSAFAITAHRDGFTGGLIIGEMPWGMKGASWKRYVSDPIELGGLFVDASWRGTSAAYRLMTMALTAAVRMGRTPVAITETGSAVHQNLPRIGAEPQRPYVVGEMEYTPWILTPARVPIAA